MRIHMHIGLEKTGTTSIQAHCARNARRLRASGILYPTGLGDRNHLHLAVAAADFSATKDLRVRLGVRTEPELASFRQRVADALREQIGRARPEVLLLSSEHLSSRCGNGAPQRLREILTALSDDVRVLVYLRRQDDMLLSLYSTYLKGQGTRSLEFLAAMPWFHYDDLLGRWAAVFGRDRMDVRIFPPKGTTLIEDFQAAVRLPSLPQEAGARANPALDHRNAHLLAKLNVCLPLFRDGALNPDRDGLVRFLEARSTGPRLGMSLDARRAFLARFEDSNERVRAAYFPHLPSLFDPIDPAADDALPPDVTFEDAIELAAAIWTEHARLAARVAELERRTLSGRLARTTRRLTRLRSSLGLI